MSKYILTDRKKLKITDQNFRINAKLYPKADLNFEIE
jgi:hypothetical protein